MDPAAPKPGPVPGIRHQYLGVPLTQAAAVAADRRGGDAQHPGGAEMRQHLGPRACVAVVRLIHHQQLEQAWRELVQPSGEGLNAVNAGDLHWLAQIHRAVRRDQAMRYIQARQGCAGLA